MNADSNAKSPNGAKPAKSLSKVLGQSEHIKNLMEESAEELSSINTTLKKKFVNWDQMPEIENTIEKSEAVESKVKEASGELSVVNHALEDEVKSRQMLEYQLEAAIKQEETANHAAFHDPLTGLANRVLFNDRLEHGLAQAKRHGWTLAVMFMDLDDFKSINDSYGHDVGDYVLQTIARRLNENTRGDDTVSRYGGDEFLYLLMEMRNEQDITLIAEKIMKAIQVPLDISGRDIAIKPSIGISIFPKDGITADTLVKNADKAMYQAKRHKSGYSFVQ
jgi:diguanylate cyclase (GGDEF)-like protein